MTSEELSRPDEHEREVARREAEATGREPDLVEETSDSRIAGSGGQEEYADEVAAERTGRTGEEVEREEEGDERTGEAARWFTG